MINEDVNIRHRHIINEAWQILFSRIISGRQAINKEASMQLQLARILQDLGNAYCINPKESFSIELETGIGRQSIDITSQLGTSKAAIELKCFRKESNRAKDLDMYDMLKDIERLESYKDYEIKNFICLTDHGYYAKYKHKGKATSVSTRNGTLYSANIPITPGWQGQWKVNRDSNITLLEDLEFNWIEKNNWYYFNWIR